MLNNALSAHFLCTLQLDLTVCSGKNLIGNDHESALKVVWKCIIQAQKTQRTVKNAVHYTRKTG